MHEMEVKTFVALISGAFDVFLALGFRHGVPFFALLLISEHIVTLCSETHTQGAKGNTDELDVTSLIIRGVVFAINVCRAK